jgi:hypothetical protein
MKSFNRLLATGLVFAAAGCGSEREPEYCYSDREVSPIYKGDITAVPGDPSTWKRGVKIASQLHPEAEGVVIFEAGSGGRAEWADVGYLSANEATSVALRIGPEAVKFSFQTYASPGSPACDSPPKSEFGRPGVYVEMVADGAAVPYQQP